MAGLSRQKRGWTVSWYESGKRTFQFFRDEADARAFMASKGLTHDKRGPGEGRRRRTPDDVLDHLAANFELDEHGCWVWTSRLTKEGYASMTWRPADDAPVIAGGHRLAWTVAVDAVPAGLVIDHLCRNRACVNPDHLEPVTQRENVMRSPIAPGAINAAKTHCPQGHPYSPENTHWYTRKTPNQTTGRLCRTCQRNRASRKAAS